MLPIIMFFDSIKFRLPGVKTGRVPSCFHFCFLWIKIGTRISVGEISQNHQFQICSRSLPQTRCTSSTVQHVKEPDKRNPRDGRAFGSTKPTLTSYGSLFFLFSDGMCNRSFTNYLKLPEFLSLIELICWSQKLNSKNLANQPYSLQALPWINLHTLHSSHSFYVLVNIFLHRNPMLSK